LYFHSNVIQLSLQSLTLTFLLWPCDYEDQLSPPPL
jgi:hypothetical protein